MDLFNRCKIDDILPVDPEKPVGINQSFHTLQGKIDRVMMVIFCTDKGAFLE
jgi:hypothetical protein